MREKLPKNAGRNKRSFFKYVNSRLTVRPEITAMKGENRQHHEDDSGICEALAKYFNSVYLPHSDEEMPEMQNLTNAQIGRINLSQDMVREKLEKLNVNKSCGPDEIHPHVLQRTASAMCKPLLIIFQM